MTPRVRLGPCVLALALLLLIPSIARGQIDTKAVARGKQATALVETKDGGSASAFCVDAEAGLFITNAHAVGGEKAEASAEAREVRLVLASGEAEQKVVTARVLRAAGKRDLAVVQVDPAAAKEAGLTALELGDSGALVETQPLTAFGYPFGRWLAQEADEYPSISVSTGRVTSLRKTKGRLNLIQLDNALNPGNSGGPVLDDAGRAVGVVVAGIRGSGVNFAIPVSLVREFLAEPVVTFTPEPVPHAARSEPRKFTINVVTFDKSGAKPSVELILDPHGKGERKVAAEPVEGSKSAYEVTAPPVPAREGPPRVQLTARYTDGAVSCVVEDVEVTVGGRRLKLSEIRRVETQPHAPPKVVLDGEVLRDFFKVAELRGDLGELSVTLDLTKATGFEVSPMVDSVSEVPYAVIVTRDGKEIGRLTDRIAITDAPLRTAPAVAVARAEKPPQPQPGADAPPAPADAPRPADPGAEAPAETTPTQRTKPPEDAPPDRTGAPEFTAPDLRPEGKRTVRLPGAAESVVAGGGGRFLVFHLKKQAKLAVFDVSRAEVVKLIPLPAGDVIYAAGLTKLFVGLIEANAIQRWDLNTLEREVTAQGPDGGLRAMATGYDVNGLLFVSTSKRTVAIDPKTMRGESLPWNKVDDAPHSIAISADNRLIVGYNFAGWAGAKAMVLAGGKVVVEHAGGYIHYNYMMPAADGGVIYDTIQGGRVWPPHLTNEKPVEGASGPPVPAYDPGYFVTFGVPEGKPKLLVHNAADFKVLTTRTDVDELAAEAPIQGHQRMHLYPQHRLLVTIGGKGEEVVLRTFDVLKELDESGLDYLLVTSRSPWSVIKGASYRYPVRVLSKRGGTSIALESGPPGMTISKEGVLTWNPPTEFKEPDVNVTLLVKDAGGQEVLHAFSVRVLDPPVTQ